MISMYMGPPRGEIKVIHCPREKLDSSPFGIGVWCEIYHVCVSNTNLLIRRLHVPASTRSTSNQQMQSQDTNTIGMKYHQCTNDYLRHLAKILHIYNRSITKKEKNINAMDTHNFCTRIK